MKILLAEDDYIYNESIKDYLELTGHKVDAFFDGESALDAIMSREYQVLLIDIKMPKLSGHKLIQYTKDADIKTPIIIITSLIDIDSIAVGYQLGCNDYLKKPFELKELELRMHELVKKSYQTDNCGQIKLCEGVVFNFESGIFKKDGTNIELTSKELDIIRFLIQRKNTFCSIEALREFVWENKDISYSDIRMYIRKIRVKAGKDFIKTSRGLGYKIDVISQ
ncbi:MAG: response regulator transcription factor [Campylobacteraceae bacterium]|jgi:DNA-binding response OmpR family regulator|nr:response regulator transcription factor [Campylobacteraceae bacterium]